MQNNISDFLYKQQELFIILYIDQKKDHLTIENYNRVIDFFIEFTFLQINSPTSSLCIDADFLKSYIKWREKNAHIKYRKENLSFWTIQNDLKILKLFFIFIENRFETEISHCFIVIKLIDWSAILDRNDFKKDQNNFFTEEIQQKYLLYFEKKIQNSRTLFDYSLSLAFKLSLYTDLKASEICNFTFLNFQKRVTIKDEKYLSLKIISKNKSSYETVIPYLPIKKEYSYFKRRYKNENISCLFYTKTGKKMTRFTLYRAIEFVSKELDITLKVSEIL